MNVNETKVKRKCINSYKTNKMDEQMHLNDPKYIKSK